MKQGKNESNKKKMSLSALILKKIGEFSHATIDSFFPENYPEAALWRLLLGLPVSYEFSRSSFSALLSRLKKQGLVERKGAKRKSSWMLTSRGKKFLEDLENDSRALVSKSDGKKRIVTFDIPENERYKRGWIRRELVACDFRLLHQSVWIGECPLSQAFMDGLKKLGLRKYVHIFSIENLGTLDEE